MHCTIIFNIGEWEWVDASAQLWMTLRAPPILGRCHQFGLPGLVLCCWALCAWFFVAKKRIIYIYIPKEGYSFLGFVDSTM